MVNKDFNCISTLLKDRVHVLNYDDLYPAINDEKLKSIFSKCAFWNELDFKDTPGPNWFYIQFKPVDIPDDRSKKPIRLGIHHYSNRFYAYKFTDIDDLLNQKDNSLGTEFLCKKIGLDHQLLYNDLKEIIDDCLASANS